MLAGPGERVVPVVADIALEVGVRGTDGGRYLRAVPFDDADGVLRIMGQDFVLRREGAVLQDHVADDDAAARFGRPDHPVDGRNQAAQREARPEAEHDVVAARGRREGAGRALRIAQRAARRRHGPGEVEEVAVGVDPGPLDGIALGPAAHHPGLAAADVEHAEAVGDVAIIVEQPELAVGDRVLNLDVALGDRPISLVVHSSLPHWAEL